MWTLKRNCSLAPRQLFGFYSALCVLSLAVAGFFWWLGAHMVMHFTWLELLAVGAAMLVYAWHAADSESIALHADRLTVEHAWGARVERVEFQPPWVRVGPEAGDGSLIELSCRGCRVEVGRYLRPESRRQLAEELRMALLRHSSLGGQDAAQ